ELNAEVACVTIHEDSVIAVGTEKGRVFLNSRREIQTDFYKFCRVPCLQNVTAATAHTKDKEGELGKPGKDGEHGTARAPSDPQANVFVLRKMVEEVFTVLYSKNRPARRHRRRHLAGVALRRWCRCAGEALGKSSLLPVPYDAILKEPGCVVAHGLPDGVGLKKPCEYDTRTLMKILEQSHRIQFSVTRPAEDPPRDAKTSADLNHNPAAAVTTGGHGSAKAVPPPPPSGSSAASSNAVLSSFLYGMPMSSKPHPDGKLDFKAMSFLSLGKDRAGGWTAASDKMAAKDGGAGEESRAGEHAQSPPGVHISKRLLFSIVHEKSEKWDSFIRETEDINTLRECVQILFNSRYAEALGLDHMVPVPYRKIACDPGAVEIIGIPDQIPFKRPCTYGVPKLKRILDERHGIRFIVKRMFDERIFTAVRRGGKTDRQEFVLLQVGERLREPAGRRRSRSKPRGDGVRFDASSASVPAGPSGDRLPAKRIKSEPPDGDIIQVTVPEAGASGEEPGESVAEPAAACRVSTTPSAPAAPQHPVENHAAEALGLPEPAKVPYSKFQIYPEDLMVTGLPDGISLRRPNCYGTAKLRKILAAGSHIQFVIKRPELLSEQVKQEVPSNSVCDSATEDGAALSKRPGFSGTLELPCSRTGTRISSTGSTARRWASSTRSKCLTRGSRTTPTRSSSRASLLGSPSGNPAPSAPRTWRGSWLLQTRSGSPSPGELRGQVTLPAPRRWPTDAKTSTNPLCFPLRPFQGLIPKPGRSAKAVAACTAPRRVTLLKKAYASIHDEDDISRMGEKVVLREQVKELFNKKYGEALGLDHSVLVPYKLIRGSPESVEVSGLPEDVPFRNPNTYDIVCLEKILQAADKMVISVKNQLQPFAEICSQACNTGTNASVNRRKRKRVQESSRVAPSSDLDLSTNQIPVMVSEAPRPSWSSTRVSDGGVSSVFVPPPAAVAHVHGGLQRREPAGSRKGELLKDEPASEGSFDVVPGTS
ncbi:unnamed protein product, partial [Tetraodon nigroviridis]